jgi:hypothetical protein
MRYAAGLRGQHALRVRQSLPAGLPGPRRRWCRGSATAPRPAPRPLPCWQATAWPLDCAGTAPCRGEGTEATRRQLGWCAEAHDRGACRDSSGAGPLRAVCGAVPGARGLVVGDAEDARGGVGARLCSGGGQGRCGRAWRAAKRSMGAASRAAGYGTGRCRARAAGSEARASRLTIRHGDGVVCAGVQCCLRSTVARVQGATVTWPARQEHRDPNDRLQTLTSQQV